MKTVEIKEGDWFILNGIYGAVVDGVVPDGTIVEATSKWGSAFNIKTLDGEDLVGYCIHSEQIADGYISPAKRWEDIVAGDLFELTYGFYSVEMRDCGVGTIVEAVDVNNNNEWAFREFEGSIDKIISANRWISEEEFKEGGIKYVGNISTYNVPVFDEVAATAPKHNLQLLKYKSSVYDTEYTSLEEALVDLVLTDYFQNTVTFKNGLFGDMLLDTFTQEQKTDIVKWILGIETV